MVCNTFFGIAFVVDGGAAVTVDQRKSVSRAAIPGGNNLSFRSIAFLFNIVFWVSKSRYVRERRVSEEIPPAGDYGLNYSTTA